MCMRFIFSSLNLSRGTLEDTLYKCFKQHKLILYPYFIPILSRSVGLYIRTVGLSNHWAIATVPNRMQGWGWRWGVSSYYYPDDRNKSKSRDEFFIKMLSLSFVAMHKYVSFLTLELYINYW